MFLMVLINPYLKELNQRIISVVTYNVDEWVYFCIAAEFSFTFTSFFSKSFEIEFSLVERGIHTSTHVHLHTLYIYTLQ